MKNYPSLLHCLFIVASIVLAMSFGRAPRLGHCYAVCSETATQYTLCEKLDGQTEGVDYECIATVNRTCVVCSDVNHNTFPITVNKGTAYVVTKNGIFNGFPDFGLKK